MYVSAERLALADREVTETFDNTSIAWQAIPHWDTGNPGQARVRNDKVDDPGFIKFNLEDDQFQATIAQLEAPTADSLLAEVMARTTTLASKVDWNVFYELRQKISQTAKIVPKYTADEVMNALIDARAYVEDAGYRAPSCLITNTAGLKLINQFTTGYPIADSILSAANINSLHRTSLFVPTKPFDFDPPKELDDQDDPKPPPTPPPANNATDAFMILIGRRQRIAHGAAAQASPGEEPLDLAVSLMPNVELVGEDKYRDIEMAVSIRFALRIKDPNGVVLIDKK